jgi:hypothetical protein
MMFTPGGQQDLLSFGGAFGGGGKGSSATPVLPTYTDPVNGKSFSDTSTYNGYSSYDPVTGAPIGNAQDFTGQNALNAEIAQRQAQDLVNSNTATATADATTAQNESDFQSRLSAAQTAATTGANQYFTQNGYDPAQFSSELANAINTSSLSVQDLSPNPTAAFSPNLGASILADVNAGDQTKAGNAVSSLFSPTYAADNISSSWLDPAVSSALSSQFDPLTAQLTNAYKRGTLNDQGYAAAQTALAGDQTAARSTVSGLGQNILAGDQTGLNNYITGAKNDAANVNASTYGAFNPNTYATGASNLVSQDQSNFAGDLTNAIGSTSFADLPSLLNAGGAVQGASDPTATNPTPGAGASGVGSVSDAYIAQQALANQTRGLGSQGAF